MKLHELSLIELIDFIEKKKISSSEVNNYFSKRIERYNKKLNVYLTVPDETHQSSKEGALKGVGLAFKDNISTKDIRTTASSKVLDNYIPPYNATIVEKILASGGAILGKTNMDAWAHGSSTETSDYGTTRNPYDLDRVPGGSSGGSAVAVASGLVPAAIGTETAESIRQPAAWSGVVGLKPSYGRVSRYGIIAMGSSWDCPGPMTHTVEDAAFLLEILAGQDPYDATSSPTPIDSYRNNLSEKKKLTIGYSLEYFKDVDQEIRNAVMNTIDLLKKNGHSVKEISLMNPKYAVSVYMILQRSEVSSNLSRYDGIRFGNPRSYFASEAKRRIMLGTYALSHGYYDQFYKKAEKVRGMIVDDFNKVFEQVDVIIAPTTPIPAMKIGESEKYPFYGEIMDILGEPVSAAGIPPLSIPLGLTTTGLPIGVQIMGKYLDESTILNVGYELEKEVPISWKDILKKYE